MLSLTAPCRILLRVLGPDLSRQTENRSRCQCLKRRKTPVESGRISCQALDVRRFGQSRTWLSLLTGQIDLPFGILEKTLPGQSLLLLRGHAKSETLYPGPTVRIGRI